MNGFTNQVTWLTSMHINNDQSRYKAVIERCKELIGVEDDSIDVENELTEYIKLLVEGGSPLGEPVGMYGELLQASFGRIDYKEIAEFFIDRVKEMRGDNNE